MQNEIPTVQNSQALFRDNHFRAPDAVHFSHSLISSLKIVCGEAQNEILTAQNSQAFFRDNRFQAPEAVHFLSSQISSP